MIFKMHQIYGNSYNDVLSGVLTEIHIAKITVQSFVVVPFVFLPLLLSKYHLLYVYVHVSLLLYCVSEKFFL